MVIRTFLVLLVLAAPGAAAATLEATSADRPVVDGHIALVGTGPATTADDAALGTFRVHGATGSVTVWERTETSAETPLSRTPAPSETVDRTYRVANATLVFELSGEPFRLRVRPAPDARVSVAGTHDGPAAPDVLATPIADDLVLDGAPTAAGQPRPAWRCEAGWTFAGVWGARESAVVPAAAVLAFRGAVALDAFGGNVTFADADGVDRAERLGAWTTRGYLEDAAARVEEERFVRLVFEGTVADASFAVGPQWGLCAPTLAWDVEGAVRWSRATGEVEVDGKRRAFQDATVAITGRALLGATVRPLDATYRGEGDFAAAIDGAAVGAASTGVAVGTSVAALTVAAAAVVAFFYTRVAPGRALEHPRRRAIWERVAANPGIHQRELQRAMGGAWGAFAFHLRVLVKGGYVRLERHGAYTLVFLAAGPAPGGPVIPHAIARKVYEAVPASGVVRFADLQRSTGLSRQLLSHHVRNLEARGLLEVVHRPGRSREVARTPRG